MSFTALKSNARRASSLLKALANERRLMILCLLFEAERSVGELERLVGLSQSALSQHLARLRRDRLVRTRRSAQTIYYSLAGDEAVAILAKLHDLYGAGGADSHHPSRPVATPEPSRLPNARPGEMRPAELRQGGGLRGHGSNGHAPGCAPCAPCSAAD